MAAVRERGVDEGRGNGEQRACEKLNEVRNGPGVTCVGYTLFSLAHLESFCIGHATLQCGKAQVNQPSVGVAKTVSDPQKALYLNKSRTPWPGCCFSGNRMLAVIIPEFTGGVAPFKGITLFMTARTVSGRGPVRLILLVIAVGHATSTE